MKKLFALSLLGCLLLAACSDKSSDLDFKKQLGPDPELSKPSKFLLPPMKVPERADWGERTPKVAEGLQIEKIADNLLHPRTVYVLENNDILVVESNGPGQEFYNTPKQAITDKVKGRSGKGDKGGNQITLLRRSADGKWEKHVLVKDLYSPFGVAVVGDYLYVANTTNVQRYPFKVGQTQISGPGEAFADLPDQVNHHWTKSMVASPDGSKLYIGVGSNSNAAENGMTIEYRRAVILEMDVKTGASRIFASGIRNPTAMDWEPESGQLWAVSNERDELGANIVPDYLTSVHDKDFFGWPWSYWGQNVDTRVQPERPEMVKAARRPDYALGSHVAVLGLHFYRGTQLPEKYRGGAFVSEHGSWNRSPLSGYEVVYVPFKDGKPSGMPETIVSGFYADDQSKIYGAPVAITEDRDGALILADDVGKSVWRISRKP